MNEPTVGDWVELADADHPYFTHKAVLLNLLLNTPVDVDPYSMLHTEWGYRHQTMARDNRLLKRVYEIYKYRYGR